MSIKLEIKKILSLLNGYQKKDMVTIYQMGKVGSQSLKKSIINSGLECVNIYSLKAPTMKKISRGIKYNNRSLILFGSLRQKFYSILLRNAKNKKIITVVRDPIARDVSLLYYFLSTFIYNIVGQSTAREFTLQELIQKIYDDHIIHSSAINWLEEEFNKTLKIDIYNYPFDKENGYTIIDDKGYEILVLTLEKMKNNEKVIASFLGTDKFKLSMYNAASEKWYKEIYSMTKDKIKIKEKQIKETYQSKYMKHFYNTKDISDFRNRWNIDV